MSEGGIRVPEDLPDDPEVAYLRGFRMASEVLWQDAQSMTQMTESQLEEHEPKTGFHDGEEDEDANPECEECGEEKQWNPAVGDYICMNC